VPGLVQGAVEREGDRVQAILERVRALGLRRVVPLDEELLGDQRPDRLAGLGWSIAQCSLQLAPVVTTRTALAPRRAQ